MAVLMVEKKDESMGSIRAVWKVESKACYWAYAPVALMVKWMVVKMAASRVHLTVACMVEWRAAYSVGL